MNRVTAFVFTYWKVNSVRTGLTVAHELGHVLGMKHDFLPAWDQHNNQVRDKCTSDEIQKNSGILIMNYGQPRVRWSVTFFPPKAGPVWDIPAIQASPEEYLHLPELGWQE